MKHLDDDKRGPGGRPEDIAKAVALERRAAEQRRIEEAVAEALNEQAKGWCEAADAEMPLLEQLLGLVPAEWDFHCLRGAAKFTACFYRLRADGHTWRHHEARDRTRTGAVRAAALAYLRAQPASERQCQSCQHWDLTAEPSIGGARLCSACNDLRHPASSCQPSSYVPRCQRDTEPAPSSGERPADASERVVRAAAAWATAVAARPTLGSPAWTWDSAEQALLEAVRELQSGKGSES